MSVVTLLLLACQGAWAAGTVIVRSDPPGAAIAVDGRDTGMHTPATVSGLPAGNHNIEARSGCTLGRASVTVTDGGSKTVDLSLVAQGGMLSLQLTPPTAGVELDGSPTPVTGGVPMAVDCGAHRLKVSAPGFQPAVLAVEVAAGRTTSVPVSLAVLSTGSLAIDVAPVTAQVWMDDQVLGIGPRQLDVAAGPHTLRATLDGYSPQERQVVVDTGAMLPVAFSLQASTRLAMTESIGKEPRHHRWVGLTIAGLGVAGLGWGTAEYLQARPDWDEFLRRRDKVQAGDWPLTEASDPAGWAYQIYDDSVKPRRNRMLIADTVGGLLLAGGIGLTIAL